MCEIFALNSKTKYAPDKYLRAFFSHSDEHHSGWGIALIEDGNINIEKEPVKASDSKYLKERLNNLKDCKDMLAHIRLATVGYMEYKNTHPFTVNDISGRKWVQIHNGTMFEASFLSDYSNCQDGTTDSEQMLYYFKDCLDSQISKKGGELSFEERFKIIDDAVCILSDGCKLNMMLHDGEYLYVHRNYKDSLYFLEDGDAVIISTSPLSSEDEWLQVPGNMLLAYKDGKCVKRGTNHGHSFEFSEEQLKYIYTAIAML